MSELKEWCAVSIFATLMTCGIFYAMISVLKYAPTSSQDTVVIGAFTGSVIITVLSWVLTWRAYRRAHPKPRREPIASLFYPGEWNS